ncbi:MAG: 2-phosphosulfolactate phosphatase, partial [Nanoarchaeota archaeon]|nr:2-phosphosulfolactate phosphatase [Nanoarchaeota archaeon]
MDIFKHTSQIAALLEAGVKDIYPAKNINEARKIRMLIERYIGQVYLCGEDNGVTTSEFNYSDSPLEIYENSDKLKD